MDDITVTAAAGPLSSDGGSSGFFRYQHLELLCGFTALWAHLYENVYTLQYSQAGI